MASAVLRNPTPQASIDWPSLRSRTVQLGSTDGRVGVILLESMARIPDIRVSPGYSLTIDLSICFPVGLVQLSAASTVYQLRVRLFPLEDRILTHELSL